MPDQRSLLRGRLASAIDGVADVASQLGPPAGTTPAASPPPPPLESVGRPWTLAAAMEPVLSAVVEYSAPQGASFALRPQAPPPPPEHHRSKLPLVIASGLISVVLIAAIAFRLLQGGAPGQPPAQPTGEISLTGVRPVASAPAAGGAAPLTQVSFPANTTVVDIEVNSGGAAGQAPVQVVVTLGQPAQTIIQNDYVLSATGATVIPLTPPGGAFAPGNYQVTITYRGDLIGSTAFAVH
jgi:hypothetical protein